MAEYFSLVWNAQRGNYSSKFMIISVFATVQQSLSIVQQSTIPLFGDFDPELRPEFAGGGMVFLFKLPEKMRLVVES